FALGHRETPFRHRDRGDAHVTFSSPAPFGGAGPSFVAVKGLDAIALGIDDESGVIIGAVLGAQARRSVVATAGAQCGGIKGIDGTAIRRREAKMKARSLVG